MNILKSNKKQLLSMALVIISFITLVWGIVHSCFQTHLPTSFYFLNIFHFTRQSVFLILVVALLSFCAKIRKKAIYSYLSFIALINILIVAIVFNDFIYDDKQSFISTSNIITLIPYYLQYIFLPLFYGFYFYQQKLPFLSFKKGWITLIHPLVYFLILYFFEEVKIFINPNFQKQPFFSYFKIFLAFIFLTLALIKVKTSQFKFIYKTGMLFVVLLVTSVIPREISDWFHAKELIMHPQQMGSFFFPETQETAFQMVNLVCDQISKKDGEKILELGAGSGNVTKYLIDKFGVENVIALEFDSDLCQVLRKKYEGLQVIEGDACNFRNLLKENNVDADRIKGIVSTLPLSVFRQQQLDDLNNKLSKIITTNNIKLVEYRFLPFLKEEHHIEDVKENKDCLKNQVFVSSLIIPTKIFIFEKK